MGRCGARRVASRRGRPAQRESGALSPESVSSRKREDGVGKEGGEAAKEEEEKKVEIKTKITLLLMPVEKTFGSQKGIDN